MRSRKIKFMKRISQGCENQDADDIKGPVVAAISAYAAQNHDDREKHFPRKVQNLQYKRQLVVFQYYHHDIGHKQAGEHRIDERALRGEQQGAWGDSMHHER